MEQNQKQKAYVRWGMTAFCVIAASIAFGYLLLKIQWLKSVGLMLLSILMPVIYGAVLAYLLTPVYNWCVKKTDVKLTRWLSSKKSRRRIGKTAGTAVSLLVLIIVVVGLFAMLIPELLNSVHNLMEALPENMNNFSSWMEQILADNPQIGIYLQDYMNQGMEWLRQWFSQVLAPNLNTIIGSLSSGMFSFFNWVKNILIGLIVMVYLLNMKDSLVTIAKKIVYGTAPLVWANRIIEEVRYIHKVFGGFIIGKLVDSLIIGILCFLCMSLMKMPYVLLISVIVGVTNVIPFFGPFIGAIPSAVLVLLVNPIQCIYFLIFILLLQQFDGNILGPKILGESTGISSFWVLFSILLFGGLFGFVGMIIGVPTFAVIYRLLSDGVKASLRKKNLPEDTAAYEGVAYIDESSRQLYRLQETQEMEKKKQQRDQKNPAEKERKTDH